MIYRPTFRPQLGDPTTTYDGSICTYSSGAMALDRHTLGDIQVWGGELLKASGDTTPLDGGTLYDLGKAWAAYGQHLDDRTGQRWADLCKALDEGRGAVVQIERSYIPTTYRCGRPFAGTHALYINHRLPNAAMFVADPLCTAYQDVPERYIRQAVEAFGRRPKLFPDDPAAAQRIAFAVTRIAIAPPDSSTEEDMIDPTKDVPAAVCDVLPGGPLRAADKVTVISPSWPGGNGIGLYSRPVVTSGWAAIRIDRIGGPAEQLELGWVPNNRIANVRVPGAISPTQTVTISGQNIVVQGP